jgi:hypothetical protein
MVPVLLPLVLLENDIVFFVSTFFAHIQYILSIDGDNIRKCKFLTSFQRIPPSNMAQQNSLAVVNSLFPHLPTQQITLTGNQQAVTSIADLINRGYRADNSQQSVYLAISKYLFEYHSRDGETQATLQLLLDAYFSDKLRSLASEKGNSFVNFEPFKTQHHERRPEADLSLRQRLLPFVFHIWFQFGAQRPGAPPVTRVGVVTRRANANAPDTFEAVIYPGAVVSKEDICLWLVFDEAQVNQSHARPWAAVIHPAAAVAGLQFIGGPTVPIRQGSSKLPNSVPSLVSTVARPSGTGHQRPNFQPATGVYQLSNVQIPANQGQVNLQPPLHGIQAQNPLVVRLAPPSIQPASSTPPTPSDLRRVPGAPGAETDLPWNDLADCTLEELITYYPEHVLNWPGLALLYNHYKHRMAGIGWDYTEVAIRIAASRGKQTDAKFNNKLRQWVTMSGGELLKGYNPEEIQHYQGLYKMLGSSTSINVSELLQELMGRIPSRVAKKGGLRPALPLAQVGAGIHVHPTGHFADRVRAALGHPGVQVHPSQPPTSQYHPIINRLADYTSTFDERWNEHIENHNKHCAEGDYIRPMERFRTKNYRRREATDGIEPQDGQIWEWIDDHQTVIKHLEERFTREEVLNHYWRDIHGDAFLWLLMGLSVPDIVRMLPMAAKAENRALTEKGVHTFKGNLRKRKEMAINDRVKLVSDSTFDRKKIQNRNATSHPDNRALASAEKERFDSWASQFGATSRKRRQSNGGEAGAGTQNKRSKSNAEKSIRVISSSAAPPPVPGSSGAVPGAFADLFSGMTPLQPQALTPLMPLHLYDNDEFLFTYPNGHTVAVRHVPVALSSAPRWWRIERYQLLNLWGVAFDQNALENFFDQGYDILPGQLDATMWEAWAADFTHVADRVTAPDSSPAPAFQFGGDDSPQLFPGLNDFTADPSALARNFFNDPVFEPALANPLGGQLERPDEPTTDAPLAGPNFDLTSGELEGMGQDRAARNNSTSTDQSFFTKFVNADGEIDEEFDYLFEDQPQTDGAHTPPQPLRRSPRSNPSVSPRTSPRRSLGNKSESPQSKSGSIMPLRRSPRNKSKSP